MAAPLVGGAMPVTAEWTLPGDGDWTDGANWSTSPASPDNYSPDPGDEYDVVIGDVGAPYTVSLADEVSVSSLTIGSPLATLALGDSRLETPTIDLLSGTLLLGADFSNPQSVGAEIVGATISGGGSVQVTGSSRFPVPILNGVTIGVDVAVPTSGGSPPRPRLMLRNGLEVQAGNTLSIEGRNALVDIEGSQALSGAGQITFEDPSDSSRSGTLRLSEGATLTIDTDFAIRAATMGGSIGGIGNTGQSNADIALVNNGLLSGEATGQPLQLMNATTGNGVTFVNNGTVQAIGEGVTIVGGDWTNSGVFRVRDNGTLVLGGVYTPADIGVIDRQGGQLIISGRVENSGTSLTASATTGDLLLRSSGQYYVAEPTRVVGGVIDATDGAAWTFQTGALEDVTLAADVLLPAYSGVEVHGDLTLQGATVTFTSTDGLNDGAGLHFRESGAPQSILGAGTIRFADGRANVVDTGDELTLGADIVVEAVGRLGRLRGNRLVNEGAMRSLVGSQLALDIDDFVNKGSLEVAGNVTIGRDGTSAWTNEGTITVKPGGRLYLDGTFEVEDLGDFVDEGADVIWVQGTIENTGKTLDLETLGLTVPLTFAGGGIRGGVVTSSGPATLDFANSGVFDGVTLATDVTIPAFSGGLRVENGLTLDGVTLTMPEGAGLSFGQAGPQFIDGVGTIYAPNEPLTSAITTISGSELVIGEKIVIDVGDEAFRELHLVFKENRGTILADSPGTLVTIGVSSGSSSSTFQWKNTGTILVDGSEVRLFGNYRVEDIGTVDFRSGQFLLYGTLENEGRTVLLDASTGPWAFRGRVNGGRIDTADGLVADLRGHFTGVTIAGDAMVSDEVNSTATGVLRVFERLTLDGGRLVVGNDAQIDIAGAVVLDGQGEIVLDGVSSSRSLIQLYTDSHLTIGQGVTVRTGATGDGQISRFSLPVVNHGALVSDSRNRTLVVAGDLTNHGVLRTADLGTLVLNADAFVNNGRIEIENGTLVVNGPSAVNTASGVVSVVGNGNLDFAVAGAYVNQGEFDLADSLLTLSGQELVNGRTGVMKGQAVIREARGSRLHFVNEGVISPGYSAGVILFGITSAVLEETGTLEIEIGGAEEPDFDRVVFLGDVQLGGVLDVLLLDGFELGPNQQFVFASVSGLSTGQFEGLTEGGLVDVHNGVPLYITYRGGDGNDVALYTVPEPLGASLLIAGLLVAALRSPVRRASRPARALFG